MDATLSPTNPGTMFLNALQNPNQPSPQAAPATVPTQTAPVAATATAPVSAASTSAGTDQNDMLGAPNLDVRPTPRTDFGKKLAQALDQTPIPTKPNGQPQPGGWAKSLLAGWQRATSGLATSLGDISTEKAPAGQGIVGGLARTLANRNQRLAQQQQMSLEERKQADQEKKDTFDMWHANAQMYYQQALLHKGEIDSQVSQDSKTVEDLTSPTNGAPAGVLAKGITSDDLKQGIASKKFDPGTDRAFLTGSQPVGDDENGNPIYRGTYTVLRMNDNIDLSQQQADFLNKFHVTDTPLQPGQQFNRSQFITLHQRALNAMTAEQTEDDIMDKYDLSRATESQQRETTALQQNHSYINILNHSNGNPVSVAQAVQSLVDPNSKQYDPSFAAQFPNAIQDVRNAWGKDSNGTYNFDTAVQKQQQQDSEDRRAAIAQAAEDKRAALHEANENTRAALSRENSKEGKKQDAAVNQIDKLWTDPQHGFNSALAQLNQTKLSIQAGADGSGLITSLVPTMEVLGINHAAGISRISPQEAQAAGLPGSWAERFDAWADKAAKGKLTPQLAAEGQQLMSIVAQTRYQAALNSSFQIGKNNGVDMSTVFVPDINGNLTDANGNLYTLASQMPKSQNQSGASPNQPNSNQNQNAPVRPTPQDHIFNATAWAKANPGKDVNAAIAAAKAQGYQVTQ
jgi:hypothetical protein